MVLVSGWCFSVFPMVWRSNHHHSKQQTRGGGFWVKGAKIQWKAACLGWFPCPNLPLSNEGVRSSNTSVQSVCTCLRFHQITFHTKWFLRYLRDTWHYCQGLWFVWSLFFFVNLFLKTYSPFKNIVLLPEYKSFQPELFWFSSWLEGICEHSPETNSLESMENHYILLLWSWG